MSSGRALSLRFRLEVGGECLGGHLLREAGMVLPRADSAFYAHPVATAAAGAGAEVSLTVRMDPALKAAIATIGDSAWETIKYTNAVFDEESSTWLSDAEVAEVDFTAFSS